MAFELLFHRLDEIERKLDRLLFQARADRERDKAMSVTTDEILMKLEEANTRQDAFLVLLQALKDAQGDPAKLQQIAQSIDEQQADWEAAFAANVPPEPPPVEEPLAVEPFKG